MSSLTQAEKDRIVHLWAERRRGLSVAEMTELCELAKRLLMRSRLPPEYADSQARADLIHDFIVQKIVLNQHTSEAGPLASAHVLHGYLQNFVKDQYREVARNPSQSLDDNTADDDADDETGAIDEAASSLTTTQHQLLVEAGIDPTNAAASAQRFVTALAAAERAYLALNTCNDDEDQQPISAIADRLRLGSSYHYKARQLGITGSKGGFYQGYEATRIGQWLTSLGARISHEWQRELMILLVILCHQVLEHCREECA
ncbi:hypothetical protein MASR1M60_33010 [Rhodocyclaceae bacterium]